MHILLHIGLAKTGTTALQNFLYEHRDELESRGIYYPTHQAMGQLRGMNHRIVLSHIAIEALAQGSIPGNAFPENALKQNPNRLKAPFDRFWTTTLNHIRTRKPKLLILSCEGLGQPFEATASPGALIQLRSLLEAALTTAGHAPKEISSRTTVIAYLRSPLPHLKSRAQQKFRFQTEVSASTLFPPIDAIFESYEHVFNQPVSVQSADRSALINGDSVADFVYKYVPDALDLLKSGPSVYGTNQSLDTATLWALNQWLAQSPQWIPKALYPPLRARMKNMCFEYSQKHCLFERYPLYLNRSINWAGQQQTMLYKKLACRYGLSFEPWGSDSDTEITKHTPLDRRHFRMEDIFDISEDAHKESKRILRMLYRKSHLIGLALSAKRILKWAH